MANTKEDGWHGAREFANLPNINDYLTTRNDYMEYGGEYFKEHNASNRFVKTPAVITIDPATLVKVEPVINTILPSNLV